MMKDDERRRRSLKATKRFFVAIKAMSDSAALKALREGAEPFSDVGRREAQRRLRRGAFDSPLMIALNWQMKDTALALAKMGSAEDLFGGGNHGWTPLTSAASAGHLEALKIIAAVDDPGQCRHEGGVTALMCAAQSGNMDCVDFLLPLSNVQARDCFGVSALGFAAKGFSIPMIDRFVELGLPANPEEGPSALLIASERCRMPIIEHLLTICDPLAVDRFDGKSALDLALGNIDHRPDVVDAIAIKSGLPAMLRARQAAAVHGVDLPRCAKAMADLEAKGIEASIGIPDPPRVAKSL